MTPTSEPPPKPPRRWLRLSLRGLMVLILVLGAGLGYVVNRASVQRDAVRAVAATGGSVAYDWDYPAGGSANPSGRRPPPVWLSGWLGPDFFGTVVSLKLGEQARDDVMEQVVRLPHLRGFSTEGIEITDAGMVRLGELGELEEILLTGPSRLTGTTMAGFANLTRLRLFRPSHMAIRDADLATIAGMTRLQDIDLDSTQVTDAGLVHLRGLTSLQSLGLANLPITTAGLAHIKGLTTLEALYLERTRVADLAPLTNLTALRFLDASSTPLTDAGLAPLAWMTQLEFLNLGDLRITDAGLTPLRNLSRLNDLDLARTPITDAGIELLGQLPALIHLDLSQTALTDAGLDHLARSASLRHLDLTGTHLTAAAVDRLLARLPLQRLTIDTTVLTPEHLGKIRQTYPNLDLSSTPPIPASHPSPPTAAPA